MMYYFTAHEPNFVCQSISHLFIVLGIYNFELSLSSFYIVCAM